MDTVIGLRDILHAPPNTNNLGESFNSHLKMNYVNRKQLSLQPFLKKVQAEVYSLFFSNERDPSMVDSEPSAPTLL